MSESLGSTMVEQPGAEAMSVPVVTPEFRGANEQRVDEAVSTKGYKPENCPHVVETVMKRSSPDVGASVASEKRRSRPNVATVGCPGAVSSKRRRVKYKLAAKLRVLRSKGANSVFVSSVACPKRVLADAKSVTLKQVIGSDVRVADAPKSDGKYGVQ
jgi:hypothetical protein